MLVYIGLVPVLIGAALLLTLVRQGPLPHGAHPTRVVTTGEEAVR